MRTWAWLMCGAVGLGCGGRPSAWDTGFTPAAGMGQVSAAYGMTGSVSVVDKALSRLTLLRSPSALSLTAQSIALGHDLVAAQTSADRKTLFALSQGAQPRRNPNDEPPKLTLIDGDGALGVEQTYSLNSPMDQLALDPENAWAVLYGGSGVVVNPNEIVLVDLSKAPNEALTSKTLRSFGGKPNRLTFTGEFNLGGAPRRLLLVERDADIVIVDLANPEAGEITVPTLGHPAQVAYDGSGGFVAVRVAGSSDVLILQLGASSDGSQSVSVTPNLVNVGGVPATIDFARNTQGLQLVALVGASAVVVDPVTTVSQAAPMPQAFTGIRRITQSLDPNAAPTSGDVALLYSSNGTQIAYFTLGGAPGALYRSIEPYDIGVSVQAVIDIPGTEFAGRKILETPSQEFYVLDLIARQSAPMLTMGGLTLEVSPDGGRVWAFQPSAMGFASVDFDKLHPIPLVAERNVSAVFDIAAQNGDRSALALHFGDTSQSGLGATVVNALAPSTATARFYSGFELGGIR